jgi:hypothetical protein
LNEYVCEKFLRRLKKAFIQVDACRSDFVSARILPYASGGLAALRLVERCFCCLSWQTCFAGLRTSQNGALPVCAVEHAVIVKDCVWRLVSDGRKLVLTSDPRGRALRLLLYRFRSGFAGAHQL